MSLTPCRHCGTPSPAEFCCAGCAAVYAALNEAGLEGYYALRARTGEAGQAAAAPDAERYRHFDDPAFRERFAPEGDQATLHLDGVHCAACVWVVEKLPEVVEGVQSARLDFGRQQVHLRWDPARVALSDVAAGLHRLGYPAAPVGVEADKADARARRSALIRLGITGALAGNTMMLAGALYAGADGRFARAFEWLSLVLTIPAVTYGAWPFIRGALSGLRLRMVHIDLPIVLGLFAGFAASVHATITGTGAVYYDSATALVFLLLAGRFAQERGQRAAMSRAELLAALTPGQAWRHANGRFEAIPATALQAGDRVRIRTGEGVPADAIVCDGAGEMDVRLLTGESRLQPVGDGDRIFAGTVNLGGPIEARVEAVGTATRIGALLREATRDAERAPVVRRADRLASRFVAAVLLLSLGGAIAWAFIDPSRVFPVVIAFLVVTCPCALGLATPVALAVARGQAARAGLVLRSTAAIERLAEVDRVVFDKTGTLTTGTPTVRRTDVDPRWAPLVAALASRSAHPVAQAIARWAGEPVERATAVEERAGVGVRGIVAGHRIELGAPRHLAAPTGPVEALVDDGLTPVALRVDGTLVGLFGLGDTLRPDAAATVARLQAAGLRVEVLSGDHPTVVAHAAEAIGADGARGAASPEEKTRAMATGRTLMVGDGLNDTGALKAAHVSIALRGGAEIALQVADAHLADGALSRIADAVDGARRTLAVIRLNLRFSLGYNLIFATLALTGWISPLTAAILMPISSLTVVLHSVTRQMFRAGAAEQAKRNPSVTKPLAER